MAPVLRFRSLAFAFVVAGCSATPTARTTPTPTPTATTSPTATATTSPTPTPTRTPPLLVTIVVDQLAGWVLAERIDTLPASGGFARLRREGTYAKDVRYAHAVTDTAPGHSSLYTCAPPHDSGIVGNERIDDPAKGKVSILRDDTTTLVGPEGAVDAKGSSLARLRVPTLADAFRAAHDDAFIVSVSLKDRGALFGGGRKPTAALWFDVKSDQFVTSTAFASSFPPWARPLSTTAAIRTLRDAPWTVKDPQWLAAHVHTKDADPGEGDWEGLGATFPHRVNAAQKPAVAFRATPFGDDALFSLALAALDAEGRNSRPALLAISLSANDYVGHVFGPDSWEAWDELLRLDSALARFFDGLDARFGKDGWAALLSADHGTIHTPEAASVAGVRPYCEQRKVDPYQRPCGALHRVDPDVIAANLEKAAEGAMGPGPWFKGAADPYVFFTEKALALTGKDRAKLLSAVSAAAKRHPEIDRLVDSREAPKACPPATDESPAALLCRAMSPASEAGLYVFLRTGAFFDPLYTVGKGASHGSPMLHDRSVPVLARAPGRVPAGRTLDKALPYTVFGRTAASLAAVAAPAACAGGPDLTEPPLPH